VAIPAGWHRGARHLRVRCEDKRVDIDLGSVDRVTADAVGEPGERTFFLQARKDERLVTILIEKQQVQLLAASVVEILARIGKETDEGAPEEEMGLEQPLLPEWRVGRLSIGYEEDRDLLMLEAEELVPDAEDEEDEEGEEGDATEAEGAEGESLLETLGPASIL